MEHRQTLTHSCCSSCCPSRSYNDAHISKICRLFQALQAATRIHICAPTRLLDIYLLENGKREGEHNGDQERRGYERQQRMGIRFQSAIFQVQLCHLCQRFNLDASPLSCNKKKKKKRLKPLKDLI